MTMSHDRRAGVELSALNGSQTREGVRFVFSGRVCKIWDRIDQIQWV